MIYIDVGEAVHSAESYCLKLFEDAQDLRLEEVDRPQNSRWHITLSFTTPGRDTRFKADPLGLDGQCIRPEYPRHYRQFVIDAGNSSPLAMKMRQI